MTSEEIAELLLSDFYDYRDNILHLVKLHPLGVKMNVSEQTIESFLNAEGTGASVDILANVIDQHIAQKAYWTAWFKKMSSDKCESVYRLGIEIDKILNN